MKSLVGSVTLSLLLQSSKAIHSRRDNYNTKAHFDVASNQDAMLYSNSISSGSKLRDTDNETKDKVQAASEAT